MALTPNLNLHIYDKDSKPTYLVDHNNDMTAIDQGYAALKLSTDTASSNVAGLTTQVNTVQQLAESASALATQANENSSHASADASAAVAAANNANTEAAKAVAATEGLINIDDIIATLPGSTVAASNIKVTNGLLTGCFVATLTAGPVNLSLNYDVNGFLAVGIAKINNVLTPYVVQFRNGNIVSPATATELYLIFSAPWDPTWTKKTDS